MRHLWTLVRLEEPGVPPEAGVTGFGLVSIHHLLNGLKVDRFDIHTSTAVSESRVL